jgi:hypothetical protein
MTRIRPSVACAVARAPFVTASLTALVVTASLVAPSLVRADPLASSAPPSPSQWDHVATTGLFSAGVEYGAPCKLAASLRYDLTPAHSGNATAAFVLQPIASVGLGGAKAGLGVGWEGGPTVGPIVLRGTFARTFGRPLAARPNQNWVGGELEWSGLHFLSAQVGLLHPLGGRGTTFTWAVGIGLPFIDWNGLCDHC